jgi:hypothetical protein
MRLNKREIDWNVVINFIEMLIRRVMRKVPMQAIQQASLKFGVSESVIRAEMRRRGKL